MNVLEDIAALRENYRYVMSNTTRFCTDPIVVRSGAISPRLDSSRATQAQDITATVTIARTRNW
jgi:hypothetical protein